MNQRRLQYKLLCPHCPLNISKFFSPLEDFAYNKIINYNSYTVVRRLVHQYILGWLMTPFYARGKRQVHPASIKSLLVPMVFNNKKKNFLPSFKCKHGQRTRARRRQGWEVWVRRERLRSHARQTRVQVIITNRDFPSNSTILSTSCTTLRDSKHLAQYSPQGTDVQPNHHSQKHS